jgi:hypothetical protein
MPSYVLGTVWGFRELGREEGTRLADEQTRKLLNSILYRHIMKRTLEKEVVPGVSAVDSY